MHLPAKTLRMPSLEKDPPPFVIPPSDLIVQATTTRRYVIEQAQKQGGL
jgi:hypothetical protein